MVKKKLSEDELMSQASFVFQGTVTQLKATTVPEIPVTGQTAIVQVSQIIHAPAALSRYFGKELTVLLSGNRRVKVGDRLTFFATEWIFGKGVAVRSLGEARTQDAPKALASVSTNPVQALAQRKLQNRVDDADLVISGKVSAVRLPAGAVLGTARGPLAPSEHDPHWREAVVEVQDVHKGESKKKSVVVRFPASQDRMWYRAPKFRTGQEGHFILKKAGPPPSPRGASRPKGAKAIMAPAQAETYTALDPQDFQSITQPDGLKRLLNIAG
jgi:hypothetical protein